MILAYSTQFSAYLFVFSCQSEFRKSCRLLHLLLHYRLHQYQHMKCGLHPSNHHLENLFALFDSPELQRQECMLLNNQSRGYCSQQLQNKFRLQIYSHWNNRYFLHHFLHYLLRLNNLMNCFIRRIILNLFFRFGRTRK